MGSGHRGRGEEADARHCGGGRTWRGGREGGIRLRLRHEPGGGCVRGDRERPGSPAGQGAGDGQQDQVLRIRGGGGDELHGHGGLEDERYALRHRGHHEPCRGLRGGPCDHFRHRDGRADRPGAVGGGFRAFRGYPCGGKLERQHERQHDGETFKYCAPVAGRSGFTAERIQRRPSA